MRIAARTTRSLIEQRREKSMRRRAAAGTLENACPAIESVHVQLQVDSSTTPVPAPQTHALYPAAPAYFEFSCPHGDCDGSLDLNDIVLPLLKKAGSQVTGSVRCSGSRIAGGMTREPCQLVANYWVSAQYQAAKKATG